MRILGGTYKGRSLKTPNGSITRPTTSLVRSAVFDITQSLVEGASFLDIFAGSGAMGLEALSRGAKEATFIEKNPKTISCVSDNISSLSIDKTSTRILKGDALTLLKRLAKKERQFDIIYIDPPYELAPILIPEILKLLDTSSMLSDNGILFLEEGSHHALSLSSLALSSLHLKDSRRYGMSLLHIFKQQGDS